jgi:hypothetical protein
MFDGQVNASTRIIVLYDDVNRHYHVITNLTGAMAQRYVCSGYNKGCKRGVTYKCDVSCSDCMSVPPCVPYVEQRISCYECNRHFVVECVSITVKSLNQEEVRKQYAKANGVVCRVAQS